MEVGPASRPRGMLSVEAVWLSGGADVVGVGSDIIDQRSLGSGPISVSTISGSPSGVSCTEWSVGEAGTAGEAALASASVSVV